MRILLLLVLLSFQLNLIAQSSYLDPGFGSSGRVRVNFDDKSNDYYFARALQITESGNLLVGGNIKNEFMIHQLTSKAKDDSSFGEFGFKFLDFGATPQRTNTVQVLLRYPDGRILLIGDAGPSLSQINKYTSTQGLAVVRLLANGDPDPSFGTGGKLVFSPNLLVTYACAGLLQPDGKIVIAMRAAWYFTMSLTDRAMLIRLNSNGTFDSDFKGGSFFIPQEEQTPNTPPYDRMSVAIQSDGDILAATISAERYFIFTGIGYRNSPAIFRYKPNGVLDSSFATNGRFLDRFGYSDYDIRSMTIQTDGKIIASGSCVLPGNQTAWIIFRLLPNGTLDASFGIGGIFIYKPDGWVQAGVGGVNYSSNGKITSAGFHHTNSGTCYLDLFRLNENGTFDSSFYSSQVIRSEKIENGFYFFDSRLVVESEVKLAAIGLGDRFGFPNGHLVIRTTNNGDSLFDPNVTEKIQYLNTGEAPTDSSNNFGSADRLVGFDVTKGGNIMMASNTIAEAIAKEKVYMAKLLSNGKLDTAFATKGKRSVFGDTSNIRTRFFYKLSDQRFLITSNDDAIVMVDSTGMIDSSFATNGFATLNLPGVTGFPAVIKDIVEQSDHKLLVLLPGQLLRLQTDGSLDNSFANAGILNLNAPFNSTAIKVKLQPDGKILVGTSIPGNAAMNYILRCDVSGIPDLSFGPLNNGYAAARVGLDPSVEPFFQEIFKDFVVLPDGTIMLLVFEDRAGSGIPNGNNAAIIARNSNYRDLILYKLKANGQMDFNFGRYPDASVYFGTSHLHLPFSEEYPISISMAADGRIAIAGYFYNGFGWDMGLVFVDENGQPQVACAPNGVITASLNDVIQYRLTNYYPEGYILEHPLQHIQLEDGSFLLAGTQQGQNADLALVKLNYPCPPKGPIRSIRTGNWNVASSWDCNCVPGYSDEVLVRQGHVISVTAAMGTIHFKKLTIETGGSVTTDGNARMKQVRLK